MAHPSLAVTGHRPWPLPEGRPAGAMRWEDLLFAHWPVAPDHLRPLLPPGLVLDTFEGEAYLGVVPFRMRRVRPRGLPPLPWLSAFAETNVRTYVRRPDGTRPGVWFVSLDAANPLAVRIARRHFHLPYYDARMRCRCEGETVTYRTVRTHRGEPPVRLEGRYAPGGPVETARPGSLDHWLTERYCFYAHGRGRLLRGEVHHAPWPLQPASAELTANTLAEPLGVHLDRCPPLLAFARRLDVLVWSPVVV